MSVVDNVMFCCSVVLYLVVLHGRNIINWSSSAPTLFLPLLKHPHEAAFFAPSWSHPPPVCLRVPVRAAAMATCARTPLHAQALRSHVHEGALGACAAQTAMALLGPHMHVCVQALLASAALGTERALLANSPVTTLADVRVLERRLLTLPPVFLHLVARGVVGEEVDLAIVLLDPVLLDLIPWGGHGDGGDGGDGGDVRDGTKSRYVFLVALYVVIWSQYNEINNKSIYQSFE